MHRPLNYDPLNSLSAFVLSPLPSSNTISALSLLSAFDTIPFSQPLTLTLFPQLSVFLYQLVHPCPPFLYQSVQSPFLPLYQFTLHLPLPLPLFSFAFSSSLSYLASRLRTFFFPFFMYYNPQFSLHMSATRIVSSRSAERSNQVHPASKSRFLREFSLLLTFNRILQSIHRE